MLQMIFTYRDIIEPVKAQASPKFLAVLNEKLPALYLKFFQDYVNQIERGLEWIKPELPPPFSAFNPEDVKKYPLAQKPPNHDPDFLRIETDNLVQICTKLETVAYISSLLAEDPAVIGLFSPEDRSSLRASLKSLYEFYSKKIGQHIFKKFVSQIIMKYIYDGFNPSQDQDLKNPLDSYLDDFGNIHSWVHTMVLFQTGEIIMKEIIELTLNGSRASR